MYNMNVSPITLKIIIATSTNHKAQRNFHMYHKLQINKDQMSNKS